VRSLLLSSLGGGGSVLLDGGLDDSDGDSLLHVSDGESSEWWEFSKGLDGHWLGWDHLNNGGVLGFDELWEFFGGLTGSLVHLGEDLSELASNMASVAIEDWGISVHDLTWMVHDDNLGVEALGVLSWNVLGIRSDVSSLDVSDGESLNVESDVVSWDGFSDLLVMHLDGFAIGGCSHWSENKGHVWLDDTSLDSSNWHCTDTGDLVHILEWESEWLEEWSLWWLNQVKLLEEEISLVPWHVVGQLEHVISDPSGNWDERNSVDLVTNLLKVD
jgi:hypothetical protein